MIDNGTVRGDDDLIRINMEIVKLGEKLGKPVVATGDVHFLNPEDSVYRKILMYGHGFKDADNQAPLYLRTTEEMLDEFKYIPEEKRREIVIENPNKIADMCEDKISPIPEEKHPPYIPGCEEDLSNMSHVFHKILRIFQVNILRIFQNSRTIHLYYAEQLYRGRVYHPNLKFFRNSLPFPIQPKPKIHSPTYC